MVSFRLRVRKKEGIVGRTKETTLLGAPVKKKHFVSSFCLLKINTQEHTLPLACLGSCDGTASALRFLFRLLSDTGRRRTDVLGGNWRIVAKT